MNKFFSIAMLLVIQNLIAQEYNSEAAERYKEFLNIKAEKTINNNMGLNKITPIDVLEIKREINLAYQNDPVSILKMKRKSYKDILAESGGDKTKYNMLKKKKLGGIETKLLRSIKPMLSVQEYNLLTTQMIIKGTVTNIIEKREQSIDVMDRYKDIVYLTIKIKDIIKGNTRIAIDDEIVVFYNKSWLKKNVEWVRDEDYLFELEFRSRGEKRYEIGLITYHGNNSGYYPINKEIIFDEENYFRYGTRIRYHDMKTNLLSILKSDE